MSVNTQLQNKSTCVHKENKTPYLVLKKTFLNLTPWMKAPTIPFKQ